MKLTSDYIIGMFFLGVGSLVIILCSIIAFQIHSNFIENTMLFRGSVIGLILVVGGSILVNISRLQKGSQSHDKGIKN